MNGLVQLYIYEFTILGRNWGRKLGRGKKIVVIRRGDSIIGQA